MKGAVGEILQKWQKKRSNYKTMPRNYEKRAAKLTAAKGENAEISARKALKIIKMPPTEHSKMQQKCKFWIYHRIY